MRRAWLLLFLLLPAGPARGSDPPSDAVRAFLRAYDTKDPTVRRKAVGLLEEVAGPAATAALLPALADESTGVRERAREVLRGRVEDADLAVLAENGLRSPSAEVRRRCADALAESAARAAPHADALGALLRDRDPLVREAAAAALGAAGHRGPTPVVAAAYRAGVPLYTSSPGDSSIGMNIAARRLEGIGPIIDPSLDVNETAAIVLHAKEDDGRSGVLIVGGGSPKNFLLQTEPQLQEIMGIAEKGHDYFVQITDARPDTGGLSGATPSEAMTWGKVDPEQLPDTIVCYADSTIAMPIMAAYALEVAGPRPLRRLYDQRESMVADLLEDYRRSSPPHHADETYGGGGGTAVGRGTPDVGH